jgi:hypothetical protein
MKKIVYKKQGNKWGQVNHVTYDSCGRRHLKSSQPEKEGYSHLKYADID